MSTMRLVLPMIHACEAPRVELVPEPEVLPEPKPLVDVAPRLEFYRKYTEGMLRRYMRFSMEAGRVPSMLGREMFRGKVTSYKVRSFEDVVIFVYDVEKCLARLDRTQQLLVTRIAIQEFTHNETAVMMRLPRRSVVRRYAEAIDRLTAIFLEVQLLEPRKECQGAESDH
jgi:hypothetical protein